MMEMQPVALRQAGDVTRILNSLGRSMGASRLIDLEVALGRAVGASGGALDRIRLCITGDPQAPCAWTLHMVETPAAMFRAGAAAVGCASSERMLVLGADFAHHAELEDPRAQAEWGLTQLERIARHRAILLRGVAIGSALHDALPSCGLSAVRRGPATPRYSIEWGGSFDDYAGKLGRNTRRMIRRTLRRLSDDGGSHRMFLCRFSRPAEIEPFLAAVADIGRDCGSRQAPLEMRQRLEILSALGWWRGCVLYCNGEAAAFVDGCACGGQFIPQGIGYRRSWSALSVGTACLIATLRDLMEGPTASRRIDFGPGDWEYKRRLSNRTQLEVDYYLYAPTLGNRLLFPAIGVGHRLAIGAGLRR